MKIVSDDGRFEADISGKSLNLKINLQDFQGEFNVKEFPAKLIELRKSMTDIISKVELIARLLRRELGD